MTLRLVDDELLRRWVRAPLPEDHKYSRGVLGMMTGSSDYPGAALMGVHAALRTGIGMIRYIGPEDVARLVVAAHPEVVKAEGKVDAYVIGSGMSTPLPPGDAAVISEVAGLGVPSVLDAGGMFAWEKFGPLVALTPHSGELELLYQACGLSGAEADIDKAIAVAAHTKQCVVLKGSITRVVNGTGDIWELPQATAWLATAGTGDSLAGIMGSLFAAHASALVDKPELMPEAAAAAALIHLRAGLRASLIAAGGDVGHRGDTTGGPITASDLADQIPAVIADTLRR